MLGPGCRAFFWLAVVAPCHALGCGGTETSGSHSSSAGTDSGTAGGSGVGGGSSADAVTELFSSAATLCAKISACYPDLQTPGAATCTAPASGGRKILYQNPAVDPAVTARFIQCLDEHPGPQTELDEWVMCGTEALASNLACYDDCPADAEPCSVAGNQNSAMCSALPAQARLKACSKLDK